MRLLDLFCGAGGAAKGYHDAGFEVVGVDHKPQPNYPYEFHEADAMTYPLEGFDVIHASPPCQAYSIMRNLPWLRDREYPEDIGPTRERLQQADALWVIENVMGARRTKRRPDGMRAGWLCGGMFGLPFYRHRLFETNFFWLQPGHPKHQHTVRNGRQLGARARDIVHSGIYQDKRGMETWPGRRPNHSEGSGLTIQENGARKMGANYGHAAGVALAREAMQIDWMTRAEITQAIPPTYTKFIGERALEALQVTTQGGNQ